VFEKELYNGIPNVTVWRVLLKHLHLKAYKLSIVQHSFLVQAEGLVRLQGLGKFGSGGNHLIGSQTRDLTTYSVVPQPLRYRVAPTIDTNN
jgi:hypothetical protein